MPMVDKMTMFTMFEPNILPRAREGDPIRTEVVFAVSSGREVTTLTNIVPTHSIPHRVCSAKSSAEAANARPATITIRPLTRKQGSEMERVSMELASVRVKREARRGGSSISALASRRLEQYYIRD